MKSTIKVRIIDEAIYVSLCAKALRKDMNHSVLPHSLMGK